jgi:hypothetical protein
LVANRRFTIAFPILITIIIAKIAIDLTFHLWSLGLHTLDGQKTGLELGPAILASFAKPFSFQLLRHVGAVWGWIAFVTGRETRVRQ